MGQIIKINEDILYNIVLENLKNMMVEKVLSPKEFVRVTDLIIKNAIENDRK